MKNSYNFSASGGNSQLLSALGAAMNAAFKNQGKPRPGLWQRSDGDWEWSLSSAWPKAPGEARRAEGVSPLGIKRQLFHPLGGCHCDNHQKNINKRLNTAQKIRRDAFADQRQAASIWWSYREAAQDRAGPCGEVEDLAGRGVTFCGWTQIADYETELMRQKTEQGFRAYLTGRQMCGLRWVCPVCTAKRAEDDRCLVNAGLAGARQRGLFPVMLTLTTRHSRQESADAILSGVVEAEQRLKRLKVWKKLRDRTAGYARVLEWTHGKNGHHPHFHTILLVEADCEAEAISAVEELQPAYMRQLERAGRDGTSNASWRHSFQVQGAAAAEGYVTKWGSAEELTGAQKKAAGNEGLTPWQLLRLSRTLIDENERAQHAAIWWQIVQATKGKAQLYKSQDFAVLAQQWLDEQPEPEATEEPEQVASFGIREKRQEVTPRWKLAGRRTLAIREAAENHADLSDAIAAVELALHGATDVEMIERGVEDPDDLIDLEDVDNLRSVLSVGCSKTYHTDIVTTYGDIQYGEEIDDHGGSRCSGDRGNPGAGGSCDACADPSAAGRGVVQHDLALLPEVGAGSG